MEFVMDNELRLAKVWCSHADQRDEAKQQKLKEFIADCRKKKIFVCVYESGDGNLLENTKELLAYNLNNPTRAQRLQNRATRDKAEAAVCRVHNLV